MRLLMTCDAVGGVWQYATDLAAALVARGVEPVLALLGPAADALSPPPGVTLLRTGLPLDWMSAGPGEVAATGRAIADIARDHRADLVQLNAPAFCADAAFGVPVVAVAHGCLDAWWHAARGCPPDPAFAWQRETLRRGLARADVAVAPTAAFARTLSELLDLPAGPAVVHNGRASLAMPTGVAEAPGVFTAGRLWDEVKDTALLDRVAADLAVPFRAAGSLVAPHGVAVEARYIVTLGRIDDAALARELAGRPVFVSAARFEPFGLAVLEAAAAGCPLVLSGIDTFRELWTGAALIVSEQNPAAYRAAIERILADDALRAHLGEAARERAARYTPAATAAAMIDLYRDVLGHGARAAA